MPLTPKSIALLQRVKERILAEPQRFKMDYVFEVPNGSGCNDYCNRITCEARRLRHFDDEGCNTTACIAGHILVAAGRRRLNLLPVEVASKLIHARTPAPALFYDYEWPRDLRMRYETTTSARVRAKVAAEAIDRWIAGNGSFAESAHGGAEGGG